MHTTVESERTAATEPESVFAAPARPATVPVLRADPELTGRLDGRAAAQAARVARARLIRVEPGVWQPAPDLDRRGTIGLLLLDGLVCRSVSVGAERSSEVLGAGDLLRPWADDAFLSIPAHQEYEVLAATDVAVLDRRFAEAIAPFPEVFAELADRALRRARAQSVLIATSHIKRVDIRLLALFWHFAERWGRVTPVGIVVPLKLTHARLAALVGAQRPSVTTALKRMAAREVLVRNDAGHYVLGDSARAELDELCLSQDARHLRLVHGADRPYAVAG